MKKVFCRLLSVCFAVLLLALAVSAGKPLTDTVYVTVIDAHGEHVLSKGAVDMAVNSTLDEVLFMAHEAYCPNGTAGYASERTAYGISLTKLWGEENSVFGYQVLRDGAPAVITSLADSVQGGDHIYAYVYTDTESFSDIFSYFEVISVPKTWGETMSLVLNTIGFDENWNTVVMPLEGAVITVNGKPTAFVTDENGAVAIEMKKIGSLHISAEKEGMILVPPYLSCTVKLPSVWIGLLIAFVAALLLVGTLTIVKKRKH